MSVRDIGHLFVYGTLRPLDVRWHFLEPFVVDAGWPDTVPGELFDTGLDYPAAVFNDQGTIHGQTFALLESSGILGLEPRCGERVRWEQRRNAERTVATLP